MDFEAFYDFYDPPEFRKAQLALISELALDAGPPILDLACGTGIFTLDLARRGLEVTGLDISPGMLAAAREKVALEESAVRDRVEFVEGDMTEFDLGREYGAVLIPNNSFGYLTSTESQRSCLSAAHRHLGPGGTLTIEERLFTPEILSGMLTRRAVPTVQMSRTNPATGRPTSFHWLTNRIDPVSQTIYSACFIEEVQEDGTVRRIVPEEGGKRRTHYIGQFELRYLLEEAGFEIEALWGGYDRQPLTASSRSMIFHARRA